MSGISGFISVIGSLPYKKTMIDYYKPVHFSRTVEELLKRSEEGTKAAGQEYVMNTFDFGVSMNALSLV